MFSSPISGRSREAERYLMWPFIVLSFHRHALMAGAAHYVADEGRDSAELVPRGGAALC
jgi:hypothetical protein